MLASTINHLGVPQILPAWMLASSFKLMEKALDFCWGRGVFRPDQGMNPTSNLAVGLGIRELEGLVLLLDQYSPQNIIAQR